MSSWQPVVKLCLLIKGGNQYNYAVSISDLIKKTTQGKKLAKADSSRCVTDRDYTRVNLLKIAIPPYCSLSYDWSKYIRCFTKGKFSCLVGSKMQMRWNEHGWSTATDVHTLLHEQTKFKWPMKARNRALNSDFTKVNHIHLWVLTNITPFVLFSTSSVLNNVLILNFSWIALVFCALKLCMVMVYFMCRSVTTRLWVFS